MSNRLGELGESGLRFMGQMNASISHEIKNILAIMKENAGLLDDFAGLAQKGRVVLDPDKIKSLSERISRQIQRADLLANNMNRLAHSVDIPLSQVELGDCLNFMLQITDRLTAYRGAVVEYESCNERIQLTTCPFLLNQFIWSFICLAIELANDDKKIKLAARKAEPGARIDFTGLRGELLPASRDDLQPEYQRLLQLANAEFLPYIKDNCFAIIIKDTDDSQL